MICPECRGVGDHNGIECGPCDGSGRDPDCPCGLRVALHPLDGWQHLDGSISHDGRFYGHSVADLMRRAGSKTRASERSQPCAYGDHPATKSLLWAEGHGYIPTCDADEHRARHQIEVTNRDEVAAVHKISRQFNAPGGMTEVRGEPGAYGRQHSAARWLPTKRLFGPTYGLDHRLFDGEHLRPDVTHYVLDTLAGFWTVRYGKEWTVWARVYLAGSEASEWTSPTQEGNNDFDVLVGVDYDRCREMVPALAQLSDLAITDRMNAEFRADLIPHTDPTFITIDGQETGPWSNTFYVNPDSYDIRDIKPYAAYDVTRDIWSVRPPHLPDWSIESFPQGHGLLQECQGYASVIRAILRQPEPYRSQQADALWRHLHGDRSRAFGPNGEGWYDAGNVIEKYLDQAGLWEQLAQVHFDAVSDPRKLLAPAGWSNDPR